MREALEVSGGDKIAGFSVGYDVAYAPYVCGDDRFGGGLGFDERGADACIYQKFHIYVSAASYPC